MSKITQSLKIRRNQLGFTQAEIGKKLGVPQSHISKIEAGTTDPRISTIADIARLLDQEIVLVPRELLSIVLGLVKGESNQKPMWSVDEEDDDL